MAAYLVVDILKVKDEAKLAEYKGKVGPVVSKFGGRYLAAGGPFDVLEGKWRPTYPLLLQFPSLDRAREWYNSEDYRELKLLRQAATDGNLVLVDGLPEK